MTKLAPAKKDEILDYLSRLKEPEAVALLGGTAQGLKLILNTRRIGASNFEKVHADMVRKGIKVGPIESKSEAEIQPENAVMKAITPAAKTPNELIEEARIAAFNASVTTPTPGDDQDPQKSVKMPSKDKALEIQKRLDDSASFPSGDVSPEDLVIPETVVVNPEPWEGRKLMICFPCYKTTNPATLMSIVGLLDKAKMMFSLQPGTELRNARNKLADTFLKSGCEWSFWLDDDMIVPFGNEPSYRHLTQLTVQQLSSQAAGQHAILRLVHTARQRNVKIVSGLYFGRNQKGRAMTAEGIASSAHDRQHRNQAGKDVVTTTAWPATGCLLVHRDVFLTIKQQDPKAGDVYPFFSSADQIGEDKALGLKAKAAGFTAVVDHMVCCAHVGYGIYTHVNTQFSDT